MEKKTCNATKHNQQQIFGLEPGFINDDLTLLLSQVDDGVERERNLGFISSVVVRAFFYYTATTFFFISPRKSCKG